MQHNKLVRDNIPEIIIENGSEPVTRILGDDAEYDAALGAKLLEEVAEYQTAETPQAKLEELADLAELIHTCAVRLGATPEGLERLRAEKVQKRGGFSKRIFLVETRE